MALKFGLFLFISSNCASVFQILQYVCILIFILLKKWTQKRTTIYIIFNDEFLFPLTYSSSEFIYISVYFLWHLRENFVFYIYMQEETLWIKLVEIFVYFLGVKNIFPLIDEYSWLLAKYFYWWYIHRSRYLASVSFSLCKTSGFECPLRHRLSCWNFFQFLEDTFLSYLPVLILPVFEVLTLQILIIK